MEQLLTLKEELDRITEASDLFGKIKKINIDHTQENVVVFYLNVRHKVIKNEVMFKGGLDHTIIDPKTLFRKALKNNARNLIVAHNHPSGDLTPSESDRHIYDELKKAGKIIKLPVLDFIIFNKKQYYSLRESEAF